MQNAEIICRYLSSFANAQDDKGPVIAEGGSCVYIGGEPSPLSYIILF